MARNDIEGWRRTQKDGKVTKGHKRTGKDTKDAKGFKRTPKDAKGRPSTLLEIFFFS